MNKRKLRRVAIVALVLVLLCNTLGVQASTKKDDPTVIVKDYGSLYTAIAEAKDNDVIGIQGTITIPDPVTPPSGGDEGKTDPDPTDPTPTEPTDPTPIDPEPTDPKPTEPDKPNTTEPSTEDPKPSTPSNADQTGGGDTTTDNSDHSTTDNSQHNSTTTKRLRKYEKLKEDWETDNKELIEAERLRTKREELLSADPETLRALGITPPPVQKVSRAEEVGESVKSNDDLMSHDEYLAGLVKIRETKNYGRYK